MNNFLYYLNSCIGIAITLFFGMLDPISPITPFGMQVVGIFLGMIWLWSFVSLLWPSLLGIIALALVDGLSMNGIFVASFGNPIPILIFFAMILLGAIQHFKVSNYISYWFLTRKIINGKPALFTFVFLYATYILAALSANLLPGLLLMWSILYGILTDAGYKKGDAYSNVMIFGTLFAAISGQAAKPFTGSALLMLSSYEKVAQVPIDYLPYMLFGVILNTCSLAIFTLVIKYILRPDMSKIAGINIEQFKKNPLPPMDLRQKILFFVLFAFLIAVLLPSILPSSIGFISTLKKLGPTGIAIAFVVALCFLRYEGKPLLNFKEITGKYVVWDIYILITMAVGVTGFLNNPQSGITPFITETFAPLMEGFSAYITSVLLIIFGIAITQVANNGVMGAVLMPFIGVFATQTGMNFAAIATLMTFAMHIALLTPAASPYSAVLYANVEWISGKSAFTLGLVAIIMTILIYAIIGIPVMNIIF